MSSTDKRIYLAFLHLLKNKEKITISSLSNLANIDRFSIYYRLNKLVS